MSVAETRIRFPKDFVDKIKAIAGSTGKSESDIVIGMVQGAEQGKTLDDIIDELTPSRVGRVDSEKGQTVKIVEPREKRVDLGNRIKDAIADATELRVFLNTLGIDLSGQHPQPQSVQQQPAQPQEPKKSVMEWVTELRALNTLDQKESDPELKAVIKELKDATIKAMETEKKPAKDETQQLLDRIILLRAAGMGEEAKKYESVLAERLAKIEEETVKTREALHDAEKETMKREMEWREKDLQHQIDEIKNAPTELQQITQLSKLADQDSAIRAYMNTKLGIKAEEPMTPEKLGKYIENIKVPVGDILKGIYDHIIKPATQTRVIPPPVEAPTPPAPSQALEQATLTPPVEVKPPTVTMEEPKSVSFGPSSPKPSVEEAKPEMLLPPMEETITQSVEETPSLEPSLKPAEAPRPRRSLKKA